MDKIIIYKKEGLPKEKIATLKFSYQREYEILFATFENELIQTLYQNTNALVFYFVDRLQLPDRILIRNIKSKFSNVCISLCTHKNFALDAWKMRVFYFQPHPITNENLYSSYKEFILKDKKSEFELVLKTKNGTRKLPVRFINYLKASGNYTQINLIKDKSILQTKQLHTFEFLTEESIECKRIHRSYILNFNNIKEVGNQQLVFYQTAKPLPLSKSLETKIKKALLSN